MTSKSKKRKRARRKARIAKGRRFDRSHFDLIDWGYVPAYTREIASLSIRADGTLFYDQTVSET